MVFIRPSDAVLYGPVGDEYIGGYGAGYLKKAEYVVPALVDEASYRVWFWIRSYWEYGWVMYEIRKNDIEVLASGSETSFEFVKRSHDVGKFTRGDKLQLWIERPCENCGGRWQNFTVGGEEYSPEPKPGGGLFRWIASGFTTIAGWFYDIGNIFRGIWYVGPPIADFFDWIGMQFESIEDWLFGVADWADTVISESFLGDAWNWLLSFFEDPVGIITGYLGDSWVWLQGLRADFTGAMWNVLGTSWTDLLNLLTNFDDLVYAALGSVWNDLIDMYNNFDDWVINVTKSKTWLDWLFDTLEDTYDVLKTGVAVSIDWIADRFESILDIVFKED